MSIQPTAGEKSSIVPASLQEDLSNPSKFLQSIVRNDNYIIFAKDLFHVIPKNGAVKFTNLFIQYKIGGGKKIYF